ncbi:protein FAR1-RELATED SEQUENCE 5-like [Brachypodium distachyon]|uniref:protein FAR1-RELATED SEQUENCE 5-like n=1 Tax=Brachypodium distachyon TaxID=15368 RepID=UPI000D0E084D|nr:protein FAR1-RELATED SEQUENCE 5-like [Brachypodium distachyon]|eukprot:XP_024311807.1 protein FAR1-RELATED SEQUENCE 5-like [Brachypodium distachyon]
MAGDNPTARHPAMHLSTITPPQPVQPQEMMTPDPNAKFTHGEQVREDFVPKKNMVFATCEEGYEFYRQYAREAGFGIKKHKNKTMSRLYACYRQGSSTFYKTGGERKLAKMSKRVGCKAAVKIKLKGTEWFYENVELEHNHALNPNPCEVKHMRSQKNKDPVIMEYVDDLQQSGVSPIATMNVLATLNGDPELLPMNDRDLENRRAANLREEQVDDVKKLMAFFSEYRTHNPKFYYDIEFDSAGVVKNIFWSHASCQANYAEFGDVVTFDTTYRSNFYCMPLGMFVGSNHHLQNVIFGFVLVRDETQKTFEWIKTKLWQMLFKLCL